MQFMARWGNACGTDFKKDEFCNLHREWEYQRAYLEDRLRKPWVVCTEVNIAKRGYDLSSAIKEYDSCTSTSSVSLASAVPVSLGTPDEFDNNKELKEFIKIFKKQNKKSYKSKNSNTRRNKKNKNNKNNKNKE
jgi:hypothetical protein